jgi:hypothetical protein
MRLQLVGFALLVGIILPTTASAKNRSLIPQAQEAPSQTVASELPGLLQRLGVNLIASAHAAECVQEGETCTSTEQCCSGLECAGGPPATCMPED